MWKSLVQSELDRVCWLDENRRYVGASRAFLSFVGLDSPVSILGRTNEELGWIMLPEHVINSERRVLRDGMLGEQIPVELIVGGIPRKILYSNAPVYNEYGRVIGLLCSIRDYLPSPEPDDPVPDLGTRDGLTGMLNTQGLAESLSYYADQYYLRGADFVRVHIAIEDFDFFTLQYGYSHGDKIIAGFAGELSRLCGNSAVLARERGPRFVMLRHCAGPADIPRIISDLKGAASRLRVVGGVPGEIYISVGLSAISEGKTVEQQEKLAEARLNKDHERFVHSEKKSSFPFEMFRMYDHLPLSFAVYEVKLDPETDEVDACFFYVNARFAKEQGKKPDDLIGRSLHEVFPTLEKEWYDMAQKAAFLSQESIMDSFYFDCMKTHYRVTASQILRQGFCVFTYTPLDGPFATGNDV